VLVDEFAALLVIEQDGNQLVALLRGEAIDPHRHQPIDVKSFASGRGMGAHHRMRIGGHALPQPRAALRCRHFIGVERLAAFDALLDLSR
jgi:hypothetical protein